MKLPIWECFPPYGDRRYHGYLWDPGEARWVSLCFRRTVEDSPHDPRARYLTKRGGRKSDQPDPVDGSGHCARCLRRHEARLNPSRISAGASRKRMRRWGFGAATPTENMMSTFPTIHLTTDAAHDLANAGPNTLRSEAALASFRAAWCRAATRIGAAAGIDIQASADGSDCNNGAVITALEGRMDRDEASELITTIWQAVHDSVGENRRGRWVVDLARVRQVAPRIRRAVLGE